MTKGVIAALVGRRPRTAPGDAATPEEGDLVFERRRHWSSAPEDVRTAVVHAIVTSVVAETRRRRRARAVLALMAALPAVAVATATGFHPAWWTVWTVALSGVALRQALDALAPYPGGHELFERSRWLGPLTPTAARKILAAERDDHRHANQLVPRPSVVNRPEVVAVLARLDQVDDLPAVTCTVEPFRSLAAPRVECLTPGLTDAVRSLAATSMYAQRPLREVASVAARTYSRVSSEARVTSVPRPARRHR